ncbi:MAG: hypothetical protein ACRDD2_11485 [Sarcina sp.]
MIYKKVKIPFIVIFIIFGTLIFNQKKVYASPLEKTLLLYNNSLENKKSLNSLELIIKSNFSNLTIENINDYKENQFNDYNNVIIVNGNTKINNKFLISELKKTTKKICFIGNDFEDLLNTSNDLENKETLITTLAYNGSSYPINLEGDFISTNKIDKENVKAYFSDGLNEYPYIMTYKNKLIISEIPNSKILSDVFFKEFNKFYNLKENSNQNFAITLSLSTVNNLNQLITQGTKLKYNGYSFYVIIPNDFLKNASKGDIKKLKFIESIGGNLVLSAENNKNNQYYKQVIKSFAEKDLYITSITANNLNEINELKDEFSTILYCGNNNELLSQYPYSLKMNSSNILINNLDFKDFSRAKLQYYLKLLPEGSTTNFIIPDNISNNQFDEFLNYIYNENLNILNVSQNNLVSIDGITIKETNNIISTNIAKENKEGYSIINKLNNLIIIVVLIIIIIFSLIFFYYSYLNRKKFLR